MTEPDLYAELHALEKQMHRDDIKFFSVVVAIFAVLGVLIHNEYTDARDRTERLTAECVSRGGRWGVTGSHFEPPTYVRIGNVSVPAGNGEVKEYGCTGGSR
jgi:hypothetical protein